MEDHKKPPLLLRENNSARQLPAVLPTRVPSTGASVKRVKTWYLLYVLHSTGKKERITVPCGTLGSAIIYSTNFCNAKRFHKWMLCIQEETRPALPPIPNPMPDGKKNTSLMRHAVAKKVAALAAKPDLSPLMPVYGRNSGHVYNAEWFENNSTQAQAMRSIWLPILDRSSEKACEASTNRRANQDGGLLGSKKYTVTVSNQSKPAARKHSPRDTHLGKSIVSPAVLANTPHLGATPILSGVGSVGRVKDEQVIAGKGFNTPFAQALKTLAMRGYSPLIKTGK